MSLPITIISGLPRSGTSMMMKMLQAGGMEILIDGIRTADEDNPKGYFEYEKVKQLHKDSSWLPLAQGKIIKIVSPQLAHLPSEFQYRVVFMERHIEEIIRSQNEMLKRRRTNAAADDQAIYKLYVKHLAEVSSWLAKQENFTTCNISYNKLLSDPLEEVQRLIDFLGEVNEPDKLLQVIDPSLYRKRHG